MNKIFTNVLVALSLLILTSAAFAQTGVGKISGKALDTDTREPLIGANIILLNTNLGAAADIDGNYFILNITPGTYDVRVSYVGYAPKTIQGVRIVANITYELNVDLSTDFTLPEIVVEDTKFFEAKSTNTVRVIDSDQIARLPVKGVTNIVGLQSGVVIQEGSGGVDGNATINVRGGRGSEVLFIIDGVPQTNVFTGVNRSQVSDDAIEQVSFQVGGYEAKYGQAQSGIVNITTKSGQSNYNVFADVITSEFTDDYGYNQYTLNISGPIIPGNRNHTIFLSGERGWFLDGSPPAIDRTFESIGKTVKAREEMSSGIWRFTGRTTHNVGDFRINLGANVNFRDYRLYIHSYAKNNAQFNPAREQRNYSFSARISQTVSPTSFWNLNVGVKRDQFNEFNPHFRDDLFAYGDSATFANLFGVSLTRDGQRIQKDENNVFFSYGRVNNFYQRQENDQLNADATFTSQIDNHLFEIGGGTNFNLIRNYTIGPVQLAAASDTLTLEEKFEVQQPTVFGYDITGQRKTNTGDDITTFAAKKPFFAYAYLQDRFELEDLVLNIGLRVDYFDTKTDILREPILIDGEPVLLPFAGGSDPNNFDPGDFVEKEAELEFSPRIGLGFPLTETTVFHAQYGRFIQIPRLTDLYTSRFDLEQFISFDPQYVQDGSIISEETIQYEVGFRQLLGDNAAMNITLFYKNIKGLVNRQLSFFQRVPGGEQRTYIHPVNSDFGTSKGLAFSLDVTRLSYFNFSLQYTFAIAEGTGSATNSSQTAVFRSQDNEAPKVIAPLDFDQRHTGVATIAFYVPEGELGMLEMTGVNALFSFASGRPYTPLDFFDILSGNNGGPSTTGYVNSRNAPGTFRIDLKVEKSFKTGGLLVTPYLWIQNLLGSENITDVWRSTGDPNTTGWLNTPDGQAAIQSNGEGFRQDYESLERDPDNFGIPLLIRLGLKVNLGL
ncbi:MAG: TonB-dependent receptor [Bacteroidetes bacterium]|nr:TonB-dependent receptor [Bacteroidota bacterium]